MPQISQQELGGDRERPNPIQQQGGEQVALGVNCGAGKLHDHLQMEQEGEREWRMFVYASLAFALGSQTKGALSTTYANKKAIRNKRSIHTMTHSCTVVGAN